MDAKDMIDMPEQEFRRAVVERFNAQGAALGATHRRALLQRAFDRGAC